MNETKMKFCKHCGSKIDFDAVVCTFCGKQVEALKGSDSSQIVINNANQQTAPPSAYGMKEVDKWTDFFLCLFLGWAGGHKFYEGKAGLGILYLFTGGLFLIGVVIDLLSILGKPARYYV